MEYGNNRVRAYLLISCALLAVFIWVRYIDKPTNLKNMGSTIAYPFLIIQNKISNTINWAKERKKTYKELVQELEIYAQDVESLKSENISLKAALNYSIQTQELAEFTKQYSNLKYQIAQIVQKNFSPNSQFFLLSCGSKAGIQVDMAVVYKNFLVGRITESYPYWSKATLITDKLCKVAAYVSPTGAKGICQGTGDIKSLSLNFVSHLDKINIDDTVLSTGQGLIFPQGFSLGKIKNFRLSGLHYEITVEPEIDISNLEYCYIVQRGEFSAE